MKDRRWQYVFIITVALLLAGILAHAQDLSHYDSLAHERFHIENSNIPAFKSKLYNELNYARMHPQTYGKEVGVDLSGYTPAKPLQVDWKLEVHAQRYAEWMLKKETLKHSKMPYRESILWNYDICTSIQQFIIDEDVPSLSHRRHLLNVNEGLVGVGIASGWVGSWYRNYVVVLTK